MWDIRERGGDDDLSVVSLECNVSQELLVASMWRKNMPKEEANMEATEPRKEEGDGFLMSLPD